MCLNKNITSLTMSSTQKEWAKLAEMARKTYRESPHRRPPVFFCQDIDTQNINWRQYPERDSMPIFIDARPLTRESRRDAETGAHNLIGKASSLLPPYVESVDSEKARGWKRDNAGSGSLAPVTNGPYPEFSSAIEYDTMLRNVENRLDRCERNAHHFTDFESPLYQTNRMPAEFGEERFLWPLGSR
jgi:hypothetical protein